MDRAISKYFSRGWTKIALVPRNRAGAKKLSTAGQKLRWCPENGAGTKKLSTAGQKRPFVPRNRAQTPISGHRWTASCIVGIGRSTQESVNRANVNRVKKKDDTSC
ncbi:MAG: hypothetical protein QM296_02690 [Bacillota bacterium]|nr:hypothetical protein [Bacillota bacterium]